MGIETLEFGDFKVGKILHQRESIIHLRQQTELNRTFSDWMTSIHNPGMARESGPHSYITTSMKLLILRLKM